MASPTDQQYRHQLPPPPQHQQQPYPQQQQQQRQQQRQQQQPIQQQSLQQFQKQLPADAQLQYSKPSQQQSSPQSKPRTFSFRSDKSRRSSGSKHPEYRESSAFKESQRLHTKADPTFAMNEAEPSAVAAMKSESLVAPLRSLDHRDSLGNPIAEPDRSNPTRSRWERPLDTIRSFEAAIDGGYTRKSLSRAVTTDSDSVAQWNRRSSVMPVNQYRYPQENYYGSRPVSFRAESGQYGTTAPGTARNSVFDAQSLSGAYAGGGQGPLPNRNPRDRGSRMQSEPYHQTYGREQNVYPLPHKDRSYETVTSAAASGNSDPAGYQTDPTSSDNSSIRRTSPAKREPVNDYGIGFSQPQAYQPSSFSVGLPGGPQSHPLPPPPPDAAYQSGRPQVPRKENTAVLRRQPAQPRPAMPEKRKSWFSRRFSKTS